MAHIVVIGLGNFGSTLALELAKSGHQVLGVDIDPKQRNAAAAAQEQSNVKIISTRVLTIAYTLATATPSRVRYPTAEVYVG